LGRRRSRKTLWIGAGACVALLVLIVALALGSKSEDSGHAAHNDRIAGSFDDWLQAVCQTGTYLNGGAVPFRNATGSGNCRPSNGPRVYRVFIANWDSDFAMRNDMVAGRVHYYVAGRNGDLITAFAVQGPSSAPLEPLTQFGFTINTINTPSR